MGSSLQKNALTRPDELIGQSALCQRLTSALCSGRIHHAYLLLGDPLSGKRTLARIFASMLLCSAPKDGIPCGECASCKKMLSGNHPDYHVLRLPKGKAHLDVDTVRTLSELFSLRAYSGGRCVAVIENAETMTPQAQNALLKTLEEPPADCIILLLCTSLSAILPTVLSRCALLRLRPLETKEVYTALCTLGCEESTARTAALFSRGSMGEALCLAETPGALQERAQWQASLENALSGKMLPQTMGLLSDRKTDLSALLDAWTNILSVELQAGEESPLRNFPQLPLSNVARALQACTQAAMALNSSAIRSIAADVLAVSLAECSNAAKAD